MRELWSDLRYRYPIGLDIGTGHVAAAQVTRKKGQPVVSALFYRELNGGNGKALEKALRDIRKTRLFSGRRVVVSIPSEHLAVFPLHFELMEAESVEEAIVRESEHFLPFPLEEAVIDYPSLTETVEENRRSYKALVVATPREDVEKYLALLKPAGLQADAFDVSLSALVRLHHHLYGAGENPVVLGHLGERKSLLTVATAESIAIERNVDWGTGLLVEQFVKNMGISSDRRKAREILKRHGLAFERDQFSSMENEQEREAMAVKRAIYQVITPYVDEFLHELDKAISYARVEQRNPVFDAIYLYGQATCVPSLDAYAATRLNIRTEVVNPLERIGVAGQAALADVPVDAPFDLALGLAMRRMSWP